jgi:hypothetical protein
MQNYSVKTKNSTISRGTCCHGLLDKCRKYSTKRPIFLQNKANFRKSQMDVTLNISRDYEKKSKWTLGENKPKTNPISVSLDSLIFYNCRIEQERPILKLSLKNH